MTTSSKSLRLIGLTLGTVGMLATAANSAPLVDDVFAKPSDFSIVGQKGPAPETRADDPADPFATVPGGNSGGLVFANLNDLRLLIAEVGSARMERDDDGDEYIAATIDGLNYAVDVYNCDPECADLTFTASFEVGGTTDTLMNEWNASRRFGKAYIREDGDAVIQFAINTRYGITVETFRDDLVWWETVIADYATFVGFR
ncbi:MAG: YbjN domain-containing protein [Devosiaceae bacterium]